MELTFLPSSGGSTKAWVRITANINGKVHDVDFERETGCKLGMDVLVESLSEKLQNEIENMRRNEYEAGYKDGKGKQRRRLWFATYLSWRQKNL